MVGLAYVHMIYQVVCTGSNYHAMLIGVGGCMEVVHDVLPCFQRSSRRDRVLWVCFLMIPTPKVTLEGLLAHASCSIKGSSCQQQVRGAGVAGGERYDKQTYLEHCIWVSI